MAALQRTIHNSEVLHVSPKPDIRLKILLKLSRPQHNESRVHSSAGCLMPKIFMEKKPIKAAETHDHKSNSMNKSTRFPVCSPLQHFSVFGVLDKPAKSA